MTRRLQLTLGVDLREMQRQYAEERFAIRENQFRSAGGALSDGVYGREFVQVHFGFMVRGLEIEDDVLDGAGERVGGFVFVGAVDDEAVVRAISMPEQVEKAMGTVRGMGTRADRLVVPEEGDRAAGTELGLVASNSMRTVMSHVGSRLVAVCL